MVLLLAAHFFLQAFFLKTKNEFPETFAKTRSKTAGMPDCSASDQFGTGLKTNDAGNSPVPE
jgi:hypothetical protein